MTTAHLEDFIGLMRRLWHGETATGHDGPAGRYPQLRLDPTFDEDTPTALTAFGRATLAPAGRAADAVILRTYFADETVERAVRTARPAAEQAGRDPASVQVWACYATVPDPIGEEPRLRRTVARPATYLQLYRELLVATNRWDPIVLQRLRDDPVVAGLSGWADIVGTRDEIEHIAGLLSDGWLGIAASGAPESALSGCAPSSTWAWTA